MRTYDDVYVFGDSYSTPNYCVDIEDSFWHSVGVEVGAKNVHNYSNVGNSIGGIVHLITSDQDNFNWNGLFLIGIPPLERMTTCREDVLPKNMRRSFTSSSGIISTHVIQSQQVLRDLQWRELGKEFVVVQERGWTEARVLRELYLLDSWLRLEKKANFVFVNLSKKLMPQDMWLPSKIYVDYFMKAKHAIMYSDKTYYDINLNVHKPTDYDIHGYMGHHGASGNENFYTNSLKPTLIKSGLL